jgi:hypothetical protein
MTSTAAATAAAATAAAATAAAGETLRHEKTSVTWATAGHHEGHSNLAAVNS